MKKNNIKYAAIDFETMDTIRSSVCSLSVVIIENYKITDSFYSLVKPNTRYENPYCVQTHGLHYDDVKNAPTFPEVWKEVEKLINGCILIAHNVGFEKSCINACHEEFGTNKDYEYIDTLSLSRKFLKKLPNHKLNTVCEHLNIDLKHHHNALDDARACANVFIKLNKKYKLYD